MEDSKKEPDYGKLPPPIEHLGYRWIPTPVPNALMYFAAYLERNEARAFIEDVYASNNRVYRNILIQLPRISEVFPAEDIFIQFDRDEGRQMRLSRADS